MNSPYSVRIKFELLLHMENMDAGFIAEGLTATSRAIETYLKTRGTVDDQKAFKLLNELWDVLVLARLEQDKARAREIRVSLGRLVGETEFDASFVMHPEASPLALLGMAWYSLEPWFGHYSTFNAFVYLKTALDHGCDAVLGRFADLMLRDRVTPDCVELKSWLTDCLKDPSEDFLLVAGQRIARWDLLEEDFASRIRQGLKKLAENGHVDALRMLALSHTDERPETAWAREEILAQAQRGKAFAMLIKAQRLAGLFPFWPVVGNCDANEDWARSILESPALKSNPWAAITLAFLLFPHRLPDGRPAPNRDADRVRGILEGLAGQNFSPAKAMIGLWHYTKGYPELALPHFLDASREPVSWPTEAACADFLVGMVMHSRCIEAMRPVLVQQANNFDTNDYGGFERWLNLIMGLAPEPHLGPIPLAIVGLKLRNRFFLLDNGNFDVFQTTRELAVTHQDHAAVYAYLLNLGQKDSADVLKWRERLVSLMNSGSSRGNEACILGNIFFRKLMYVRGFRTYALRDLGKLCESMGPATNLARAVTCVTGLLAVFAQEGKETPSLDMDKSVPMQKLLSEYSRAVQLNDIPILCLLPILFKMAEEQFPKPVVRATLDLVSMGLHGQKEDLHDFMASVGERIVAPGVDLGLLWRNLGFELGVDCPRTRAPKSSGANPSSDSAPGADSFDLAFPASLHDDAWEDDFPDWDDDDEYEYDDEHDDDYDDDHDIFENREKFFERSEAISKSLRQLYDELVQIKKLSEDRVEKKPKRGQTRKPRGKR